MAEPTTYIVLRRIVTDEPAEAWEVVLTEGVDARSADAAIRVAAADDFGHLRNEQPCTYVAVPARSWKPVKVAAVQTTILKLEEAT